MPRLRPAGRAKGENTNWSTSGNWDNTTPNNANDLFFGLGYDNAGANGSLISNNDLTGLNLHKIVFENASGATGGDHSFTITGNGFTLFDYGGASPVYPQIANLSTVTQTFNLTSGQKITFNDTSSNHFAETAGHEWRSGVQRHHGPGLGGHNGALDQPERGAGRSPSTACFRAAAVPTGSTRLAVARSFSRG